MDKSHVKALREKENCTVTLPHDDVKLVRIHIKLIWIGNSDWTNGRYGVVDV
jgi:hypothetical protein